MKNIRKLIEENDKEMNICINCEEIVDGKIEGSKHEYHDIINMWYAEDDTLVTDKSSVIKLLDEIELIINIYDDFEYILDLLRDVIQTVIKCDDLETMIALEDLFEKRGEYARQSDVTKRINEKIRNLERFEIVEYDSNNITYDAEDVEIIIGEENNYYKDIIQKLYTAIEDGKSHNELIDMLDELKGE